MAEAYGFLHRKSSSDFQLKFPNQSYQYITQNFHCLKSDKHWGLSMHLIRALLSVDVSAIQVGEIICFKPFNCKPAQCCQAEGVAAEYH